MSILPYIIKRFATTTANVTPPLKLFGIPGKYATALYTAAAKENKLPDVERELLSVKKLFDSDGNLSAVANDSSLSRTDKKSYLEYVLGKKIKSNLLLNFVGLIAENGRFNKFGQIMSSFGELMSAHRGEVFCKVTTASALTDSQKNEISSVLKLFLKPTEKINLETDVDPAVLGGMVVTVGDRYIDMSVASKIKDLTGVLKQNI